ncbi:MAG: hypothetical protein ACJARS_002969 [bacterium]|jgi:hypothetical protein
MGLLDVGALAAFDDTTPQARPEQDCNTCEDGQNAELVSALSSEQTTRDDGLAQLIHEVRGVLG